MHDSEIFVDQATRFFDALFTDIPGVCCAWKKDGKRSIWNHDYSEIVKRVVGQVDHYICACKGNSDAGVDHRVTHETASAISAVWVDLDVASGIHSKPNLPTSIADAYSILDAMPFKPSIVIHTGGGIHAWWLLREPITFETDDERGKAANLVERWQGFIRGKARERGWTVDATHDLARLMRIPGTFNGKTKPPKAVTMEVCEPSRRYDVADFEEWVGKLKVEMRRAAPLSSIGDLIIDPDVAPPNRKMKALADNMPKFQDTFDRTRRDLDDRSPSGYDMSLAAMAAQAKWTPQEILNLLIASRVKAGHPLHDDRVDKYKLTIAKAQTWAAQTVAETVIETALLDGTSKDPDRRDELVAAIREALQGVPIERVLKYQTDPPTYSLITSSGEIALGEVGNLIGQRAFRSSIAAVDGKLLPNFKQQKWDSIAQMLLDVCELVHVGDEATERGQILAWIESYLDEFPPIENQDEAFAYRRPFLRESSIYIHASGGGQALRDWLRSKGEQVTSKRLGTMLRTLGADPRVIGRAGTMKTMRAWLLPQKFSSYIYIEEEKVSHEKSEKAAVNGVKT